MSFYHVCITQRSQSSTEVEVSLDHSYEDLETKFLAPYNRGLPITIKGKTIPIDDLERIRITVTEEDSAKIYAIIRQKRDMSRVITLQPISNLDVAMQGKDVTDEFITGPPGSESETDHNPETEIAPPNDAREVFVVHGRNLKARDALFDFLRAIDLHPLEWSEAIQATGRPSPYIGEVLNAAFTRAHAVVVLMTPDDESQLRLQLRSDSDPPYETELTGQARPNVLFEAGMAMGRNEDRTVLVELGALKPFSDIGGRHVIRIDNSSPRRQDLAKRLQAAGCPVKLDGTDWHSAGDFSTALELTVQMSSKSSSAVEKPSIDTEAPQLSTEAKELLLEGAKGNGSILNADHRDIDRRKKAAQDHMLNELAKHGLVEDLNGKGTSFGVTHRGFEVADQLSES